MLQTTRICFACLIAFAACGGDDKPQSKLAPNAMMVDAPTQAALTEIDSNSDFVFSSTTSQLSSVAAGSVLLFPVGDKTPQGAMRYVTATAADGGGVRVSTRDAQLGEAFEELHLKTTQTVTLPAATPQRAPGTATVEQGPQRSVEALTADDPVNGVSYPFNLSLSGDDGSIVISGALAVAPSVGIDLSIDLAKFEGLQTLALDVSAQESFQATVVGQGTVTEEQNDPIATIPFAPITILVPTPVGDIPVVLTPQVVVELDIKGTASGAFTASVAQDASISAKVGYVNGTLGGTSTQDAHASADPGTYQASASFSVQAGPRFEVLIYGLVGPYAEAQGTLTANAEVGGPPLCVNWSVNAGITIDAGIEAFGDIKAHIYDASGNIDAYNSCADGGATADQVKHWSEGLTRAGSGGESARAVTEVTSGGFLVAGQSSLFGGVNAASLALWLVRLNADGTLAWQRAFSTGGAVQVSSVAEVPGGFVVAASDGVWHFDLAGNVTALQTYAAGDNVALISAMTALTDGSVVVVGQGGSVAALQSFAMRVDANGQPLWANLYGGDHLNAVHVLANGNLIAAGASADNAQLLQVDTNGNVVWQSFFAQQFDDNGTDPGGTNLDASSEAFDVIETSEGLVVAGVAYGAFRIPQTDDTGFYAGWRTTAATDGSVSSSTMFRGGSDYAYTRFVGAAVGSSGLPLLVGETTETVGSTNDNLILALGDATNSLHTSGDDYVFDASRGGGGLPLIGTHDGGFALTVSTAGFGAVSQIWALKLGRAADVTLVDATLAPSSGLSLTTNLISAATNTNPASSLAVAATDASASVVSESTAATVTAH